VAGFTTRPVIMGTHGVVAAGHYLAAEAGLHMLRSGGNAFDAGAAMGFALAVLKPQEYGIGGEAPTVLYSAERGAVFAVNGHGVAPGAATIDRFKEMGIEKIPGDGFLAAVVPAAVDSYMTLLATFGTMPLREVLAPALELAGHGFPVYPELHGACRGNLERWGKHYPTSLEVYAPGGRAPEIGEILVQRDWAASFSLLVEAERKGERGGRTAGLRAARDVFYRGELARAMVRFQRETEVMDASGKAHSGLLTEEDFARYSGRVEPAVSAPYRGLTVHKCNTWCQGAVLLQQLTLLEGFDLSAMEHNGADYIHTVMEAAKLAFADREAYYGDPQFVHVPLDRLLSKEYAAERRALVDPGKAAGIAQASGNGANQSAGGSEPGDTTHLDVVDRWGNMVSATPSGAWIQASPVVAGLGFPLGTRGQMFYLDESHPERLEPGKRPSTTLTPSLALAEGRGLPHIAFGTPGGDCQDQWTLQFFLNFLHFGMDLQTAIDAPTFHSSHFASSFYPHDAHPGEMHAEERMPPAVLDELRARGHIVHADPPWSHGGVLAVALDPISGVMSGAASPRLGCAYAMGR